MKIINQFVKQYVLAAFLLLTCASLQAQVTVGADSIPLQLSALEIISNNTRGLRLPQLTEMEREALENTQEFQDEITGKAKGLMIFNTDNDCVETWSGNVWISDCGTPPCVPISGTVSLSKDTKQYHLASYDPITLTANVAPKATGVGYQWYKNDVAIPGATSPTYYKSPVSMSDAGTYKMQNS